MSLFSRLSSRTHRRAERSQSRSRGRESLSESEPPVLPPTPRRPLTPSGVTTAHRDNTAAAASSSLSCFGLFARLPLEIRWQILVEAFGGQTLHMDLAFRRPFAVPGADARRGDAAATTTDSQPGEPHARIYCSYTYFDNPQGFWRISVDKSRPKAWRWFGCVCHRFFPAIGRRPPARHHHLGRLPPEAMDLSSDGCLLGKTECGGWPGAWPRRCFIGIMGWLLACRQAYIEGVEVLYSTNTIHISSDMLVMNPCAFLPGPRRAQMTSLELRWRVSDAWLTPGAGAWSPVPILPLPLLDGPSSSSEQHNNQRAPVFPALRYLHLSLEGNIHQLYGRREKGARVPFSTVTEGLDALENVLLPLLDEAVQRYSPPGANCVVSLPWSYCQQLAGRFQDHAARLDDPWLSPSQYAFVRVIPSDRVHGAGGRRREYMIRELGQVASLDLT